MKNFFNVTELHRVLQYALEFDHLDTEIICLVDAVGRILAEDIVSDMDLPDFDRSTMDGYALYAASTFGASEGNPAYLEVVGEVCMGETPAFSVKPGNAAKISTGGMMPKGADGVVMIEHTDVVDGNTIEVNRSVAPGQHVIQKGEDKKKGEVALNAGCLLRPQEAGLIAAFGGEWVKVYKKPVVSIISTGDEIVPIHAIPGLGEIRDINSYSLSGMVKNSGGTPVCLGIAKDNFDDLYRVCAKALEHSDMILISGGSSVGIRDFTLEVFKSLPEARILVHGISISPGKPTIMARSNNKLVWGLPGHVASAMVVFEMVVKPFIERIGGMNPALKRQHKIPAILSRNLPSAQGRVDFIRVRLVQKDGIYWAEPILGKSGLINTMIKADGLIEIEMNTEGLTKGTPVWVIPMA